MKLPFVGLIMLGLLAWGPASADGAAWSNGFPTPESLRPCAPDDPVATAEAGVATKLGGEFLSCFQSERKIGVPSAAKAAQMPVEYAFAIALHGQFYTLGDLDNLLSKVRDQWKNFDPLSKEFKDSYTNRLNDLIKENGPSSPPTVVSIKPVLVSIERLDNNYYTVTSIRTYVLELNGEHVRLTKVNSDAVVLRSSQLFRLTIQRTLSDPADVAQVQGEIGDWARAVAKN